jgi:recombination protein RecT
MAASTRPEVRNMPAAADKRPSPRELIKQELARFAPSFRDLLPKHYEPARLITGAMVAITLEPKLLDCHPVSIATALARVAMWGLDVGDTAHLLPFGKTCTPVPDYKGLIRLMLRAGARKVEAHEVRAGDDFHYEYGTTPVLRHRPGGSGPITHAYAIAWLKSGEAVFEVMTAEEIDAIRQSRSLSWKKGELLKWYARKTVVRQLAKYLDRTPELTALLTQESAPIVAEDVPENLLTALAPSALPERRGVPGVAHLGTGYPEEDVPPGDAVEPDGAA